MPVDSPLSATQLSLIPVSFRDTLPSVPPSFEQLLCKGAHFHLGRLGLSQLEHPLSGLSALSLAFV